MARTWSARTTGWLFVAVQVVLLVALVVLPAADHWPTPRWLRVLSSILTLLGLVIIVAGGLALGSSLTATPEPRERAELRRTGAYGLVRHPIYSGVLVIVLGIVIRSGNLVTLVIGVVTVGFFMVKTRWEEQRLRRIFPDYAVYAANTPRFVPGRQRPSHDHRTTHMP